MSKKLLIVRHGKAEHPLNFLKDHGRKLTDEGEKCSIQNAEKLLHKDQVSELIVSSNAARALKTAQLFADTWNIPKDSIVLSPSIYEANVPTLLSIINKFEDNYNFIAIFGHNPGFTDLVNYLTDEMIYDLPTSGAVLIEFNVDSWKEISHISGKFLLIE